MPTARSASPSIDLRILLRSIGQIVLQANAFTGAMLVAALALTDLRLACAALVGAAGANLTAVLTGAPRRDVEQGLHGFNGALAALVVVLFAPSALAIFTLVPLAATGAGLVQRAIRTPLAKWRQCPYSSPCLIATALWLPFVAAQHAGAVSIAIAPTLESFAPALLSGVAQTTFAHGAWAGALIVAGIAANAWDSVRSLLNGAIDKINAAVEFTIDLPGPKNINVNPPNIPHLASGGVTNGPTVAVVGDNFGGQEVVSPLDQLWDQMDKIYRAGQASVPVEAGVGAGSGSSSNNGAGRTRLVEGTLSIDKSGRAYIRGVAEDVYDGNERFEAAHGRMGG